MTETKSVNERWSDWVEQCPLRIWRKQTGLSIVRCAATLDVTVTTIQNWERGVKPSDENMAKLISRLGDKTLAQWKTWLAKRPEAVAA